MSDFDGDEHEGDARARRSGRVKNKPRYTTDDDDDDDDFIGDASEGDEEEGGGGGKRAGRSTTKTARRKKTSDSEVEDEDAYKLSEEDESEVSEEYEDPDGSTSDSDSEGQTDEDEDEEWDRQRRRFVSAQRTHPRPTGYDLPPFLAEAVTLAAASRPMSFAPSGSRPSALTPEQLQEIARNTVSTLASVHPITGRKLPVLLPRPPQEQDGQARSSMAEDLKQSITSLLMDPATREAMIRRLQGASAVARPVSVNAPPHPVHPLPPRPVTHLAPRKVARPQHHVDPDSVSASRPRRAAATKKVDYSSYFKEEEDDDGEDGTKGSEGSGDEDDTQAGIEKILSFRKERRDKREEFFVKYWGLGYLHCEWVERGELEQEKGMASRIKKFLSKPLHEHHFNAEHIFNPDFVKVERIVFGWTHEDEEQPGQMATSYLVKWAGLPYEDATWEKEHFLQHQVDKGGDFIEEYKRRPNVDDKRYGALPVGRRPDPSAWKPFEQSPEYKNDHALRPYQLEGVNWLVYCWMNKQSCIIADEMGLGKTVQSVAFLDLLYKKFNVRGPFLVVCPLSTLPHWQREFEAWTDLNVIVYHGSKASRDVMYEYEFFFKNAHDQPIPGFTRFDVMITTYEMAMAGIEQLLPMTWRIGIFDEAHRLKNRASKAADVLKTLEVEHKVLLSGTPIQNSILELWSLLSFLQPQRFFSEDDFMDEFGDLSTAEDVERLQDLLKPLMLRRLKEDVEKSIPVKEETIIEVELTPVQKRYYRAILEKNFTFLTQGCTASNAPNLLNAMMELRKCCIHPYLIKGAEERILEELGVPSNSPDAVHGAMIQASGKLVLVDKLLRKLREGGHRVLIFSQMTKCLDILADYLKWRQYPMERIDGSVKGSDRQAAIDRFCDPAADAFIFLLCTRAGGVGINLTAADTVLIFDSDWNPQNDLQAQARCHRIGQTRPVKIYRLITRNTYERDMFDRAGMKLGLDRAVLQKMVGSIGNEETGVGPQLSRKEVETLLKRGAYGVLMDANDDEDASNKFCEEDIEQILERRTTVIRHDDDGGGSGPNAKTASGPDKKSIFSKASFTATAADDFDIDIDDPNFWELWAKKLDMNPRALLAASSAAGSGGAVDEPRVKRLIKRLKNCDLHCAEWCKSEAAGVPHQGDRKGSKDGPVPWSDDEIGLLQRQLALHGIGRFADLPALFPLRSKNDIIAAGKAMIKAALDTVHAEGSDEKFKEDAEKAILWKIDFDKPKPKDKDKDKDRQSDVNELFQKHEIPYPEATAVQCHEFKSLLAGLKPDLEKDKKLVLRTQVMEMVRQIVERQSQQGNVKGIAVPQNVAGAAMPNWWGRDADVDLIIGTFRHGYGASEQLKGDPELVFSTMTFDNNMYEWPTDEQLDGRLRKLLINMEKRAQVATKLAAHQLGDRRRTMTAAPAPATASKTDSPKGRRQGKRGKIVSDSESEDDETYIATTAKAGGRGGGRGGTRGAAKRNAVDAINEMRTEALSRWSTKERNEFHRIICLTGLPAVLGKDHAEDDTEDEDDESPFFKGQKRDWRVFRETGDFDADKTNSRFNEWCEEYLGLIELQDKHDDADLDAGDDRHTDAAKKKRPRRSSKFPADKANKAQHAIGLFARLRQSDLDSEPVRSALGKARRSAGLPKWWVCDQHDLAFLVGAAKHGLADPGRIILDPDLPFADIHQRALTDPSIASNATSANKRSTRSTLQPAAKKDAAAIVGWPNESVSMRRIEYLLDLVDKPDTRPLSKKKGNEGREGGEQDDEGEEIDNHGTTNGDEYEE